MAPKKAAAAAVEEASDPNERVLPPVFNEESLAAISFDGDEFTDPEERVLPASLEAAAASWERPSVYLESLLEDGATPYVVQPPAEPPAEDEPPSRKLPNLLEPAPAADDYADLSGADARRALQWMVSSMQLVALHAASVDEGCFLWELIHPQEEGRPRYVPSGKYAVKLFEQGAWRLVTVDDRMPFDASGAAMLPRSTAQLELWPLLIAKAIYKLASGAASSLSQDPTVLLRMTGWLPQVLPISPRLPLDAAWGELHARIASERCVLALMLPSDAEADAPLASVGLHRGPLVAVRDVRDAEGEHYVRIESEQLQWAGVLRDTDEESWTPSLASALDWKRWQRLRIRAAGLPLHDAWLRQKSLNAHFGAVLVLHRPAVLANVAWHTGTCDAAGATPPALVFVEGSPDDPPASVLLGLHSAPASRAPGGGSVRLALQTHAWQAGGEAQTLLELDSKGSSSLPLTLKRGTPYRLAVVGLEEPAPPEEKPPAEGGESGGEEAAAEPTGDEAAAAAAADDAVEAAAPAADEAPPAEEAPVPMVTPPCRFAVSLGCDEVVSVGSVPEVAASHLGLTVSTLEGALPELAAGEWRLSLGVSLKAAAACTVNASLKLNDAAVAACARLHVLDEESCEETSLLGLSTGPLALVPNGGRGHTLLLDVKSGVALPACGWTLQVAADGEVEVGEVSLKPPQGLAEAYAPNPEYVLFRCVLSCDEKGSAAVHVATDSPAAELSLRVLRVEPAATGPDGGAPLDLRPVEHELKAAEGLGCASLLGVALEPAAAPAGGGSGGKKGAPAEPAGPVTVLECRVKRRCAEEVLKLPIKPPEPRPEAEEAAAPAEGAEGDEAAAPAADEPPPPPSLDWVLTVASASPFSFKKDPTLEQGLQAVRDGWEAAQPGRSVKAKAVRDGYLAAQAAAAAEAGAPGKAAKVSMLETADGLEGVDLSRCDASVEPMVVSVETRAAAAAEREAALAALAEEREAAEKKREERREKREAALAEQLEAAKAARAAQLEVYAARDAEREAMMAAAMPEKTPAEPVEPAKGKDAKGKDAKGKKK